MILELNLNDKIFTNNECLFVVFLGPANEVLCIRVIHKFIRLNHKRCNSILHIRCRTPTSNHSTSTPTSTPTSRTATTITTIQTLTSTTTSTTSTIITLFHIVVMLLLLLLL